MSRFYRASLVLLALIVVACSAARPPTRVPDFRVAAIEPEDIKLDRQVFRLRLVVTNSNTAGLRVAAARLRLDLENIVVGTGDLVEGFSLAAGEEGSASLRIVTDLARQGPQLLAWLMSGDSSLDYRVTGYVDLIGLGLGRVPVDERGRIPLAPPSGSGRESRTTAI
jgi:hypothetical protein